MAKQQTTPEQIADAMLHIAKANHYLVGFIPPMGLTWGDLKEAEQILITQENSLTHAGKSRAWVARALTYIQQTIKTFEFT